MNKQGQLKEVERVIDFVSDGDNALRKKLEEVAIGFCHEFDLDDVGMYDSTYRCIHCGVRVGVSIDAPETYDLRDSLEKELCSGREEAYELVYGKEKSELDGDK